MLTIVLIAVMVFLCIRSASILVWTLFLGGLTILSFKFDLVGVIPKAIVSGMFVAALLGAITPIRRRLFSSFIMKRMKRVMPHMSETERVALEAGTVGWESELFSGNPHFDQLLSSPLVSFTAEERAFFDGPLNTLCGMINDWDITHNLTDLPIEVWAYIKAHGFLGMIIPKEYGGLGFSATAQTVILIRLYGRSVTAATTVSVPNSLGPAELLLKYGTDSQKQYYLPRLAKGIDIPCFALTGPYAGSDAASIPDTGIVCYNDMDGQRVLGVRLNWDKRYITLCPVATVIGLAFRLYDPDQLLGKGYDVGITCALIPALTPGITKGRRHYPLNTAFLNGPTQGRDVFVSMDCLIGGADMAGQGWRMLMECLSAGRAISLPSSAVGGAQAAALASGAYARVRKQFNTSIGKFEGIEAPLARIAASTYLMDAALTMTAMSIDHGAKPSVAGAILKYHTTELARQIALDAMDIHGGKGICLGPNNYLGRGYQSAPISITVEGANILTRNLIIFGQGAIRCHPYIFKEMQSVMTGDLNQFDHVFWSHVGFIISNLGRSMLYSMTGARWIKTPKTSVRRYYELIHFYSCHLACLSDVSMMILGASLKRKESISARLGDLLSYLYLASAVLLRYHHDGEPEADRPLVEACCQQLFYDCDQAIRGVLMNFPNRWAKMALKVVLQPFGLRRDKPSDHLHHQLAELMISPNETRSRLTRYTYSTPSANCPLGNLEEAFLDICAVEVIEKQVMDAHKAGLLTSLTLLEQIQEALKLGFITPEEASQLDSAERGRQRVIAVDDFDDAALRRVTVDTAICHS